MPLSSGTPEPSGDEPISEKEFDDNLRSTVDWVVQCLAAGDQKSFIPTLLMICEGQKPTGYKELRKPDGGASATPIAEGHYTVMAMLVDLDIEKRFEYLDALGQRFGSEGTRILAAYFVSEAWLSQNVDADPNKRKYRRPSEDPNRQEIVGVMGLSLDRKSNVGRVNVKRDQKDHLIVTSVEHKIEGWTEVGNPLLQAFYRGYAIGFLTQLEKDRNEDVRRN